MHQQGGDSSTDKEVMAILSSPGQQKLVKPQPRPGGLATAAASLRMPTSPLANGKALPGTAAAAATASSSSDYFSEMAVGGSGSGGRRLAEAALALEDSARNAAPVASPPRTPVLPKSTGASWDPQVQSSSSAFSVPAGRGSGRGGRPDASPGVGSVGDTGLRGLTLGGFRVVGGDTADPKAGDGQGRDRQGGGGGRTPGPTKGLRYPLEDSTLGHNALGGSVLREGKPSDVNANANAVEATRGGRGHYGLVYDGFRSDDAIFGGHDHQDHHARSLSDPYSAPHEALGNNRSIGGGGNMGTDGCSSEVGLRRRGYDMPGLSGPLDGGASTTARDTTPVTSAAAAKAAARQGYPIAKDEAEALLRASESSSLDNWGILQYGLTLEGSMTGTAVDGGSGVGAGDASGSRLRRSREVSDGDDCGGERGDRGSGGGSNGGDAGGGGEPPLSSSSASVEMMMASLFLREQSSRERRYAGEADPREGAPSTSGSLLYSGRGGVQAGDRSRTFMRERGRAEDDGMLAGDYGLAAWPEAGGKSDSDFSFLRAQRANYQTGSDSRASALHQQLLHSQQANPAPLHPRRAMGGSPSLAPMRRRHPSSSGNLESESFSTAPGANAGEGTTAWHSGGGDGGVNDVGSAGTEPLRWSFPPPGMGGHAGGVPADGDVASGVNRLSGIEKGGGGSSGGDIGGGTGGGSGMRSGEAGEGRGDWGGMRSVLERDHGVSRRLVYSDAAKGGGGGKGVDGDTVRVTQRDLSGSVDSHQFAMMRRQHQGIVEADNRMASGGDNGGGSEILAGGDSRAPGQIQQYSLSQHPRFSKDSHDASAPASSDYDGRGKTVDRGAPGGVSVGGGGDVSGSGDHIHGARARMSVRHHGVGRGGGVTGAPPGFPSTAYEYVEYTAGSMEGHMANGETMSEKSRGVGRARALPRDRQQQHEKQHHQRMQEQSLDGQQQHRGGAPPSDHMQLHPNAGSRSLRGGGESMRSQPTGASLGSSDGHGWERGGRSEQGVRGLSGGSSTEMDYADVYSARRGAYGLSVGHRSSAGRQLGYDAGYDGHQGSGVQYEGGVNSGVPYRGGSSSRSGAFDHSSRLAYENADGGEETLSYDVGVSGGGTSQSFSRRHNGSSRGGQSGGYENVLPQAGGDHGYRGGGGVRYSVADHESSVGHRPQGSRDYQRHHEFQQQQQPARPGLSPPERKKTRANLGYSPPEHASLSSVLPRSQQHQQQQYPQDDVPWSSAHQTHLQQHHSRGPSQQSYHHSHQYPQQQPMQAKASSWGNSRAGLEIRSASGISGANYGSTSTARRVGGGASAGHPAGQNISTAGGGVDAPGSGIGDVYGRRRLPAPGAPSSEGALGKGGYVISSPRVNVGGGGAGAGGPAQQQLYSSSPSHASIQDRRIPGTQQHQQQQQQQGFREASPLRGAMNGPPPSVLPVSMASGPPASAPFGRSSSGPSSLPNSNKTHGLSAVGNASGQVQPEVGGVGSRGNSPHRPRMYSAEPAGVGRYGFADGVSGGGIISRGEGSLQRSISHGAGVQGGYGRPPRQQQQQQQYGGVQPHVKGHMSHGLLHGTALRHPGGVGGGRGGGGAMIPVPGAPMDETQVKRAELVESPTTRLAFKDFYRAFRAKEKTSFHAAKVFAMECFSILPPKVHWRLYLEIADLARRENRFVEARKLYRKVTKLQPFASQGWVEYCKLEEEFGDLSRCSQILRRGLTFCEYSETLLIKAVKQEERAGNLGGARELLSRLKHVGIDNVWRTVLEGALLEARSGNTDVARKVLKYLMTHVPWYGPIYYEAFRLEEKAEHFESALAIVERGLQEIPRYGPLWFGAFRLSEKLDMRDAKRALAEGQSPYAELYRAGKVYTRAKKTLEKAKDCISKELVWKVHFEAAQIEERLASVCAKEVASRSESAAAAAAAAVAASAEMTAKKHGVDKAKFSPQGRTPTNTGDAGSLSPPSVAGVCGGVSAVSSDFAGESDVIISDQLRALSLQRKDSEIRLAVSENEDWLAGEGEVEVISEAKARDSLLGPCRASYAYAVLSCPQNLRWKVWLAGARMELAAGNCSHAQRLLNRAFQEVPEKSKSHVFLECARLEEFTGNLDSARQILERARVETKSEWKVFLESVLLEIRANDWQRAAAEAQEALRVHSGAGRLWAVLVQLKQRESDEAQQASLKQALKEVPKSGEVWCEGARIHLNPLSKAFDLDTAGKYLGFAVQFTPQYGDSFMECLRLGLLNDLFLPRARAIADVWQKGCGSDSAAELDPVEGSKAPNDDAGGWGGRERGLVDFISGERSGFAENDATPADDTNDTNDTNGRNGSSSDSVEGAREQVAGVDCADVTTADVSVKSHPKESVRHLLSPEVWAAIDAGENILTRGGDSRGGDGVVGGSSTGGCGMVSSGTETGSGTAGSRGEGNERVLDSGDSSGSVKGSGEIYGDSEVRDKPKGSASAVARASREGRRFELSAREMAAANRVTEGDILRAHVEELLLRCVNADPNYGSMWFHCRHRPSDTAKSILMMAKVMMADELTKLQDVYLLAVTRHVILQREADAYIASSRTSMTSNPAAEAAERTVRRRHRKGLSRGRRREVAGERRERLLETAAKVIPAVGYENPEGNLMGVRPEDFVTGLASLNRITAHMRRLRSEDRRKILFGSDQIVP